MTRKRYLANILNNCVSRPQDAQARVDNYHQLLALAACWNLLESLICTLEDPVGTRQEFRKFPHMPGI